VKLKGGVIPPSTWGSVGAAGPVTSRAGGDCRVCSNFALGGSLLVPIMAVQYPLMPEDMTGGEEEYYMMEPTDMMGGEEMEECSWAETMRVYEAAGDSGQGPSGATCSTFDKSEEVLWVGYEDGRISSFLHPGMSRLTSVKAYAKTESGPSPVLSMMSFDGGLLSLSSRCCRIHSRGCVALSKFEGDVVFPAATAAHPVPKVVEGLSCAAFNAPSLTMGDGADGITHVSVGFETSDSNRGGVYQLDMYAGLALKSVVTLPTAVTAMSCGAMLAVGCKDGSVRLLDASLRTKRPQGTFAAHSGPVKCLAAAPGEGLVIATLGMASKSVNPYDKNAPHTLHADSTVQLFDLRMMSHGMPLRFPGYITSPSSACFTPEGYFVVVGEGGNLVIQAGGEEGEGFGGFVAGYDMEVLPIVDPVTGNFEVLTGVSASSSGGLLSVTCASGAAVQISQLLSVPEGEIPPVNFDSRETHFPSIIPPPPPIPMHPYDPSPPGGTYVLRPTLQSLYATGPLSSSFETTPMVLEQKLLRVPMRVIDAEVVGDVDQRGFLGTAKNPNGFPPNSALYGAGKALYADCDPRKKSRDGFSSRKGGGSMIQTQDRAPRRYRKLQLRTGRRGFEAFDFEKFNQTPFSGLQNGMPNDYMYPVLQLLYFTDTVRSALLAEQYSYSFREIEWLGPDPETEPSPGIACELGLLFHQLNVLQSSEFPPRIRSCHCANFIMSVRQVHEVVALGLIEDAPAQHVAGKSVPRRLETFHRFLLSHLESELPARRKSVIDSLYGYNVRSVNSVMSHVKAELDEEQAAEKVTRALVTELLPLDAHAPSVSSSIHFFSDLLRRSLCRETRARAWSKEVKDYVPVKQRRAASSLPALLPLQCAGLAESAATVALFRGENPRGGPWLPEMIEVCLGDAAGPWENQVIVRERCDLPEGWDGKELDGTSQGIEKGEDGTTWYCSGSPASGGAGTWVKYRLQAVASHVLESADDAGPGHVVLHVRAPNHGVRSGGAPQDSDREDDGEIEEAGQQESKLDDWLLLNDFLVEYTMLEDARGFQPPWKSPCILLYCRVDGGEVDEQDEGVPEASSTAFTARDCLSAEVFKVPSLARAPSPMARSLPSPSQLPGKGDLIAIDTEFVALSVEEAELKEDGTRQVRQLGRQAIARVSVIDARNDSVLIDDFVLQTEPVVDYATRFSGITAQDLSPATSRHHLAHLRTTYLKLRWLIDAGCIFVGHGVTKDFHVLNVTVPPGQVFDTVELWCLPEMRKMSLRYLAHYLLGKDIQGETHDSIEDSRISLELYRKYKECAESGKLAGTLRDLYEHGRKVEFKARDLAGEQQDRAPVESYS
jgi:hypothetical protein